jgi:hypothetical protein
MTQKICDCILSQNGLGMSGRECNCEALPPTGDVGELIEKCRRYADSLIKTNDLSCGPLMARCALLEAADALTAAAARIAELESERDAAIEACAVEYRNYEAATARAERLEAGLKHYVELFCEQPNEHSCGTFHDDFCLGCKGRAALPKG